MVNIIDFVGMVKMAVLNAMLGSSTISPFCYNYEMRVLQYMCSEQHLWHMLTYIFILNIFISALEKRNRKKERS